MLTINFRHEYCYFCALHVLDFFSLTIFCFFRFTDRDLFRSCDNYIFIYFSRFCTKVYNFKRRKTSVKMQCTEITQTRGASVLLTPTSNENTVKDLSDKNQQRECKKLLAEFPNLFSRSEHDIGRINLVERTIDT